MTEAPVFSESGDAKKLNFDLYLSSAVWLKFGSKMENLCLIFWYKIPAFCQSTCVYLRPVWASKWVVRFIQDLAYLLGIKSTFEIATWCLILRQSDQSFLDFNSAWIMFIHDFSSAAVNHVRSLAGPTHVIGSETQTRTWLPAGCGELLQLPAGLAALPMSHTMSGTYPNERKFLNQGYLLTHKNTTIECLICTLRGDLKSTL